MFDASLGVNDEKAGCLTLHNDYKNWLHTQPQKNSICNGLYFKSIRKGQYLQK